MTTDITNSFASPALVVVAVGLPPTNFSVHEQLICEALKYFTAALKKEWWRPNKSHLVELRDEHLRTFNTYLNWLYTKKIATGYNAGENAKAHSKWFLLVDAYILGDKLRDADFKDALTDAMVVTDLSNSPYEGFRWGATQMDRARLYENTVENAPARKLLAHLYAQGRSGTLLGTDDAPELLVDLVKKFSSGVARGMRAFETAA